MREYIFSLLQAKKPSVSRPGVSSVLWVCFGALYIGILLWIEFRVEAPGTIVALQTKSYAPLVKQSIVVLGMISVALYYLVFRRTYSAVQLRRVQLFAALLAVVLLCTTLWIHPTRSQDVYWNLVLSRGLTEYHLNPYETTPRVLVQDSWTSNVFGWRDQAMTHGIIWVGMLASSTVGTDSITTALVIIKLWNAGGFVLLALVTWRLLKQVYGESALAEKWWIFLMLQPVWFQYIGIDVHNDVWIVVSIALSCLYALRRQYRLSALMLLVGGLFKYVPWFLLPIPLWLSWKAEGSFKKMLRVHIPVLLLAAVSIAFMYMLQAGEAASSEQGGLWVELTQRGRIEFSLIGAELLQWIFGEGSPMVRIIGMISAAALMIWLLCKKRIILSYLWPLLCIFLIGTPWFQSWYGLWIVPIAALVFPPSVVAVGCVSLLLMYEVIAPVHLKIILVVVLLAFFLVRAAFRMISEMLFVESSRD